MSYNIQASSTTSYAQGINSEAYDRMHCIWIQFVGGVKSLYDFAICLNEHNFDRNKLQNLSEKARKQINLAQQDIKKGEDEIKSEIYRLLLKKQQIETDMEDTNSKIISLSQTIQVKEEEIRKANTDIQYAKQAVEIHEEKEKKAEDHAAAAKIVTAVVAVVGGAATVGVTVLSAGLAAPVAATGVYAAVSGASAIATGVTHSNLNDARKALQEKTYALQEYQKDLNIAEKKFNDAQSELRYKGDRLSEIEENSRTNDDDSKVITKLKVCVTQCHDFINITLGRVEVLSEMRKKENYRNNLNTIMEQVIEQISAVPAIEGFSNFIEQLETMAIEMSSLCKKETYELINFECNDEKEEMSCSHRSCCVFYSCIGLSFSFVRCFFCGCRNFHL